MKHARLLLLAASTLVLFISACSQPADIQAPNLEPQFGTSNEDIGTDVVVSASGPIYALADQVSSVLDGEEFQVLLRRYDSSGKLLSTRQVARVTCPTVPECENFSGRVLQVDARGNSYVLVSQKGISGDAYKYAHYDLYKHDATGKLIKKVDLGNNYWDWSYAGEAEHANAIDMAVDGSGNIYVAYERGEKYDYVSDSFHWTNLVVKYSTSGVKQWQHLSTVGRPYGITVSGSGSVYVVGTEGLARYSNDGNLTWSRAADNSRGVRSGDIVISGSNIYTRSVKDIRKYDGNGKQLWLRTQGGLNTIVVQDMDGDGSGNVYLSGKHDAGGGNFNATMRKLNPSGSVLWTRTYGTPAYDDARGVATVSGSEVYVTGETQGSLAHPNKGERDGYLRKLNSSGVPIWTR